MTAKSVLSLGLLCFISNFIIGQTFTNVTSSLGIDEYLPPTMMGTGVSIHDVDNNGWEDIVFSVTDTGIVCYFNYEGVFERQILYQGIGHFKTCLWGDYDNDNDDDLFITRDYRSVRLLRNDGGLNFTDVSEAAGFILINQARSWGASWTDLDLDGYLDLYVSNYNRGGVDAYAINDWFYHNNGDGTFTESSFDWGFIETAEATFQSSAFPINSDIYPDILAINDYSPRNKTYLSQGQGVFVNTNGVMIEEQNLDAMCSAVKDFDNDGDFDVFVTNTQIWGNNLFVNENQSFTNEAPDYNLSAYRFCTGSSWIDVNNDLDPDLFVGDAENWDTYDPPISFLRDYLYMNYDGVFTPTEYIIPNGNSFNTYVVAKGDLNNDGFDDLVLSTSLDDGIQVLMNNALATQNGWIKVKLKGTVSNTNGYGSLIEYFIEGNRYIEFTTGGSDYLSQNAENMILPMGVSDSVDSLLIHWPSQMVDRYYNLGRNQNFEFIEGNSSVQLTSSSTLTNLCDGQDVVLTISNVEGEVLWNTGDVGFTLNVTEFGSYWAIIESPQGYLLYSDTITFEQSASTSITAVLYNPSCYGFADGIIDLGLEEGVDILGADWSDGFIGTYRENAPAGDYSVIVTNLDGCSFEQIFTLENPEFFGAFSYATNAFCFESSTGAVFVESAFGGTTPYDLYLNDNLMAENLDMDQLLAYSIDGLTAGNYNLMVLDENGCSSQANLEITQPLELSAASQVETDFVEVTAIGGTPPYDYVWSAPDITGNTATLAPGNYTIIITDSNGCETSVELTVPVGVAEISKIQLSYTLLNKQVIFNGTMSQINIYEMGGKVVCSSYNINRIDVSALAEGIYLISAVDSSNTMRIAKIVIQN